MIIAVTGHRPDKLGGYRSDVWEKLLRFATTELDRSEQTYGPIEAVLTGMALGWDQAIAQACYMRSMPFVAYVPFKGQESRWPESSQQNYRRLLHRALRVITVSDGGYSVDKMHVRNRWLVDDSERLLALWNGGSTGGTTGCVGYARSRLRPVDNAWDRWIAHAAAVTP